MLHVLRRAFALTLLAGLTTVAGFTTMGCVVEQAPPANASGSQAQSRPAHCGESQDACVARCKAQAPDEASRQPCYNQCMHQSQQCR